MCCLRQLRIHRGFSPCASSCICTSVDRSLSTQSEFSTPITYWVHLLSVRGNVFIASKSLSIDSAVKGFTSAFQNRGKKPSFLVASSPWLYSRRFDSLMEYTVTKALIHLNQLSDILDHIIYKSVGTNEMDWPRLYNVTAIGTRISNLYPTDVQYPFVQGWGILCAGNRWGHASYNAAPHQSDK